MFPVCNVVVAPVMLLNLVVPLRFTPRADDTFVKRTVTVHGAPAARVAPVQVSGPALLKNQVPGDPPVNDTVPIPTEPVLSASVNATTPVPVLTPVAGV